MDYSRLNDFVDTRECNFLSNPKSWDESSETDTGLPFQNVATVAAIQTKIYSQVLQNGKIVEPQSWQLNQFHEHHQLDALTATLSSDDHIQSSELLLLNPDSFSTTGFVDSMAYRLWQYDNMEIPDPSFPIGRMEREIGEVYKLLGWCWDEAMQHTVSKTSASHSCFARGSV